MLELQLCFCVPEACISPLPGFYVTAEALGVRFHAESWPGKQMELRDRYTVDEPMEELGVFFAAFDGHGGIQALGSIHWTYLWIHCFHMRYV